LFAAPHGLSQRTTSFIASQRQGIHRIPLRHLIALIVDARRGSACANSLKTRGTDRKDQLTSWTHSSSPPPRCGSVPLRNDDCVTSSRFENNTRRRRRRPLEFAGNKPDEYRFDNPDRWWSQTGSNRRPPACKAGALPTELWPQISDFQDIWWAWDDSNVRPHPYQGCALTT
jgi:hypothetical protein